jgi:hypothetical protein
MRDLGFSIFDGLLPKRSVYLPPDAGIRANTGLLLFFHTDPFSVIPAPHRVRGKLQPESSPAISGILDAPG